MKKTYLCYTLALLLTVSGLTLSQSIQADSTEKTSEVVSNENLNEAESEQGVSSETTDVDVSASSTSNEEDKGEVDKGTEYSKILSSTAWQGTTVKDKDGNDLSEYNKEFLGLARYDAESSRYEFFDKETGESRGDSGVFFITPDGTKRILISQSKNYQAVVELTEVNENVFTYQRKGKDAEGNEIDVFVEHIPYTGEFVDKLQLKHLEELNQTTGEIVKESGANLLGQNLWQGTVVKDAEGNDLTEYNMDFISIARFDATNGKYEFFSKEDGSSRGDFGYYSVINNNKERAHASLGKKYGAVLELTELNPERFTYTRKGKDAEGNEIQVFVEHEPYEGDLNPEFTF